MAMISVATMNSVCVLIDEYAKLCGHSSVEIVNALLASKTLARHGYTAGQQGNLTEEQGLAAVAVLEHWIEVTSEHQQG